MATMDIEECKRLLHLHATIRMPVFTADDSVGKKVDALDDHLGAVAVARGDLEEARLWADHIRHTLNEKWEAVDGWKTMVTSKATGPQITEAKKTIDPVTYDALREVKWVIARLTDQIRRLEKDEETASRRYTLITGS